MENTEILGEGSSGFFRLWSPDNVKENTEKKEGDAVDAVGAAVAVRPKSTPPFDEHSILPNGLHDDVQINLVSVPLAEVDNSYGQNETFIVLNGEKRIYRFSTSKTLLLFDPLSPIRRTCISALVNKLFAWFLIATILVNCWCIACGITKSENVSLEIIFLAIYFLEFVIKIIARGFVGHPFAYLRDPWNWLDFLILIGGFGSITVGCGTACIPLFGELRIFKLGSYIFGLRRCINQIVKSLKGFESLYFYILYSVTIIALLLMLVFRGRLTQVCVRDPKTVVKNPESLTNELWQSLAYDKNRAYHQVDGEIPRCGNLSSNGLCPDNFICLRGAGANPNYGYTNFDTYGWAVLTTTQLLLRDFWEDVLYNVVKTTGQTQTIVITAIIFFSYILASYVWAYFGAVYLVGIKRKTDAVKDDDKDEKQETPDEPADANVTGLAKFQKIVHDIIFHKWAAAFIILCIILNTVAMALDHNDMHISLDKLLKSANLTFLFVFTVEAVLKIVALGPKKYFSDSWNVFDFVIVVFGFLELGLEGVQGMSVFRSLRLFRPFRLGRTWPTFNYLLSRIRGLWHVALFHSIVLLSVVYVFVVFGTKHFGHNYVDNFERLPLGELPRWKFTDVWNSFKVVFRALCGEWIETLWLCMVVGDATCIPYYLLLVVVGNFVVIHLFLALLINSEEAETLIPPPALQPTIEKSLKLESEPTGEADLFVDANDYFACYDDTQVPKDDVEAGSIDGAQTLPLGTEDPADISSEPTKCFPESCYRALPIIVCCDEQSQVKNSRGKSKIVLENKVYQNIVLVVIVVATLLLICEAEVGKKTDLKSISDCITGVFIVVLGVHCLNKLLNNGFKSYFTNIWNIIDLINTLVPILVLSGCSSLTVLLGLRPLSIIARCENIKVVISTLLKEVAVTFKVLVVCSVLWLIFAIMGVQLFSGKFFKCTDTDGRIIDSKIIPLINNCTEENHVVVNSPTNFDNIIRAFFSLLEIATFKGWIALISDAEDSREVGAQPMREVNVTMLFYFVFFIICGVFCTFNLFIGVLIGYINGTGRITENFCSEKQIRAQETKRNKKKAVEVEPPTGLTPAQTKIYNLVNDKRFDWGAFLVLCLNCLLFTCNFYDAEANYVQIIQILDYIFVFFFAVEIGLRYFGLRNLFFKQPWNIYDIVVLIVCIGDIVVQTVYKQSYLLELSILLRITRFGRYEKLLLGWRELIIIQKSYKKATPAIVNIVYTQLAVEVTYALIGFALFGNIKAADGLNDVVNFSAFIPSVILLTQISNGAGWDGVVKAITNEQDCFVSDATTNCGSNVLGTIYIVSYLIISYLLIVNFHLVLILEYISHAKLELKSGLSGKEIEDVNKIWDKYDPESIKYIPKDKLSNFLDELTNESIRKPKPNQNAIKCLAIPENDNHLLFYGDVIDALHVWKFE